LRIKIYSAVSCLRFAFFAAKPFVSLNIGGHHVSSSKTNTLCPQRQSHSHLFLRIKAGIRSFPGAQSASQVFHLGLTWFHASGAFGHRSFFLLQVSSTVPDTRLLVDRLIPTKDELESFAKLNKIRPFAIKHGILKEPNRKLRILLINALLHLCLSLVHPYSQRYIFRVISAYPCISDHPPHVHTF